MKKTTLLLLTSCALAGCYTAPEMTENKYRDFYSDTSVCGTSTMYQNEKLRNCIENRLNKEKNKTVSVMPLPNGDTLIVPKTPDDAELKDVNRVYEVVDVRAQTSVVIEDGQMTETITEEVVVQSETNETAEADETNVANEETAEQEVVETELIEGELVEETPDTPETEDIENEVVEIEETPDTEDLENEVVETEETSETTVEENNQKTTTSQMADGVTLVVGPLKEDLVIEVKSAGEKKKTVETKTTKTQTKTIQAPAKRTPSQTAEEAREKRLAEARKKAEERRQQRKKQKEVLPSEEK